MTGASESVAFNIRPQWAVVGQVADVWQRSVGHSGFRLNVGSALAGGRYRWRAQDRISWYGQVLVGTAHLSGNAVYRPLYTFAVQPGAGLDIALSRRVAFRPVEIALLHTNLPGTHGQRFFRYGVSLVFRFGRPF